jgi:hypothetical protein
MYSQKHTHLESYCRLQNTLNTNNNNSNTTWLLIQDGHCGCIDTLLTEEKKKKKKKKKKKE